MVLRPFFASLFYTPENSIFSQYLLGKITAIASSFLPREREKKIVIEGYTSKRRKEKKEKSDQIGRERRSAKSPPVNDRKRAACFIPFSFPPFHPLCSSGLGPSNISAPKSTGDWLPGTICEKHKAFAFMCIDPRANTLEEHDCT